MAYDEPIHVEVAHARPERQVLLGLEVSAGSTVADALRLSGIAEHFPGLDLEGSPVGIFGRPVQRDRVLRPGDRVEIYRPLQADPKEVRRALAAEGRTMGGRRRDQSSS